MDNIFFDLRALKYLGVGAIVGKTVRIRHPQDCIIGDGTIIDDFAYISARIEIGKYCHLSSHLSISGGHERRFVLGDYSTLSNHCSVHCASSDYTTVSLDLPSVPPAEKFGGTAGDVVLGQHVVVGAHSCILPGARERCGRLEVSSIGSASISARRPIARLLSPLRPLMTPTTPLRPIAVLTSSQPNSRRRAATNWEVRGRS